MRTKWIFALVMISLTAQANEFEQALKCAPLAERAALNAFLSDRPETSAADISISPGNPMLGEEFKVERGFAKYYVTLFPKKIVNPNRQEAGDPVASISVVVKFYNNDCKLDNLNMNRALYE